MKHAILPIVIGIMAAAPAAAQRDTQLGSRLTPRKTMAVAQDTEASVRAGHRFAGCVYTKQPAPVIAALDAIDPADAQRKINSLQSRGTCINLLILNDFADSQRMEIDGDIYRGLLAEAVIRNRYANYRLDPLKLEPDYARSWFAVTGRARQSDEMSVCVVETDPAGVGALLATDPESAGEKAAFRALAPSLGPCLATGTKLSSNRQSLRAGLAEALYHRLAGGTAPPRVGDPSPRVPEKN